MVHALVRDQSGKRQQFKIPLQRSGKTQQWWRLDAVQCASVHSSKSLLLLPPCVCAAALHLAGKHSTLVEAPALRRTLATLTQHQLQALVLDLAMPSGSKSHEDRRHELKDLVWFEPKEAESWHRMQLAHRDAVRSVVELGGEAVRQAARQRVRQMLDRNVDRKDNWEPGRDCDCVSDCELGTQRGDVERGTPDDSSENHSESESESDEPKCFCWEEEEEEVSMEGLSAELKKPFEDLLAKIVSLRKSEDSLGGSLAQEIAVQTVVAVLSALDFSQKRRDGAAHHSASGNDEVSRVLEHHQTTLAAESELGDRVLQGALVSLVALFAAQHSGFDQIDLAWELLHGELQQCASGYATSDKQNIRYKRLREKGQTCFGSLDFARREVNSWFVDQWRTPSTGLAKLAELSKKHDLHLLHATVTLIQSDREYPAVVQEAQTKTRLAEAVCGFVVVDCKDLDCAVQLRERDKCESAEHVRDGKRPEGSEEGKSCRDANELVGWLLWLAETMCGGARVAESAAALKQQGFPEEGLRVMERAARTYFSDLARKRNHRLEFYGGNPEESIDSRNADAEREFKSFLDRAHLFMPAAPKSGDAPALCTLVLDSLHLLSPKATDAAALRMLLSLLQRCAAADLARTLQGVMASMHRSLSPLPLAHSALVLHPHVADKVPSSFKLALSPKCLGLE